MVRRDAANTICSSSLISRIFAHARLKITLIRGTPLLFSRSSNMMLALESTSENLEQEQHQGIVSREHEERHTYIQKKHRIQ